MQNCKRRRSPARVRLHGFMRGRAGSTSLIDVSNNMYVQSAILFEASRANSIITYDTLSGAGNRPGVDDRCSDRGKHRLRQNRACCSLPEAFYEFSITYTETQQLRENEPARQLWLLRYALHLGIGFPMRRLRRMECHLRRRISRRPAKLCGRLPGLLQAQYSADRI